MTQNIPPTFGMLLKQSDENIETLVFTIFLSIFEW
jgi:hypothetical protein